MGSITHSLDQRLYAGFKENWDDALFRAHVCKFLNRDHVVLDVGAGAGILPYLNFRGNGRTVYGVDLDPRISLNEFVDGKALADAALLPFRERTFDVVLAANLLEHLANPKSFFIEAARVLKPGGRLFLKTPNRRHYVALVASITPNRFHRWMIRSKRRSTYDIFPTFYAANTPEAITRYAGSAQLAVEALELVEGRPEYCRIAWPLYLLGFIYERLVNRFAALRQFRVLILATLRRTD